LSQIATTLAHDLEAVPTMTIAVSSSMPIPRAAGAFRHRDEIEMPVPREQVLIDGDVLQEAEPST
jgi:hypothetical protein